LRKWNDLKHLINKKILFIVFKQKPQQNKNFVVVLCHSKVALKLLATKEWIVIFQELSAPMFPVFIPSNKGSITLAAPSTI
jgi:hypothetical protein